MDREDELASFRDRFALPKGVIYLDGNSLGPPLVGVGEDVRHIVEEEWGGELIRAWNSKDWIGLPQRIANQLACLIGADATEVAVADSTSVNLFKLLSIGLRLNPQRSVILSEEGNFPSDLYIAHGLVSNLGSPYALRVVPRDELEESLDDSVAVLMLTHVDFRSGAMHDMKSVTERAHARGAVVLWDLAHSAGAVPVELNGAGVDLAVGCGYKYLNGGPGAPAFAFVAQRHHDRLVSPLQGWMGHDDPFAFETSFEAAAGRDALLVGTPPILSMAPLLKSIALIAEIGVSRLRSKSIALGEFLLRLVDHQLAGHGFRVQSPRHSACRGSQITLSHPDGYAIMQALIAHQVIGDFRAPDLLRFGLAPAYLRFVDLWDAVNRLRAIMDEETWQRPEFRIRKKVT